MPFVVAGVGTLGFAALLIGGLVASCAGALVRLDTWALVLTLAVGGIGLVVAGRNAAGAERWRFAGAAIAGGVAGTVAQPSTGALLALGVILAALAGSPRRLPAIAIVVVLFIAAFIAGLWVQGLVATLVDPRTATCNR